jgi:hypothetical protein
MVLAGETGFLRQIGTGNDQGRNREWEFPVSPQEVDVRGSFVANLTNSPASCPVLRRGTPHYLGYCPEGAATDANSRQASITLPASPDFIAAKPCSNSW